MNNKLMQRLTPLQLSFVKEYLFDFNATAAAKRVGFNGDYGRQLLAKPHIKKAIYDIKQNAFQEASITIKDVIEGITNAHARAVEKGDITSELRALELLGKHTGAFSKEAGGGSNQKVIVNMNFNYEQNEIIENKD